MTFYGKYRGDHHTWDHAHESPAVMLIPLYVLAAGATLSGYVAYDWFVGADWADFWGKSIAVDTTREVLHHLHETPVWVKVLPLIFALAGIALSWLYYINSSSTSGTSTSSTTGCSSGRRSRSAASSGRKATVPSSMASVRTASPRGRSTWRAC